MAWTADTFVTAYPEFAEERREMVTAKLAEAARRVSTTVWGARVDDGVALLAAHLIAQIPYVNADGKSVVSPQIRSDGASSYMVEFRRLERIVGLAARIVIHEDEDVD